MNLCLNHETEFICMEEILESLERAESRMEIVCTRKTPVPPEIKQSHTYYVPPLYVVMPKPKPEIKNYTPYQQQIRKSHQSILRARSAIIQAMRVFDGQQRESDYEILIT